MSMNQVQKERRLSFLTYPGDYGPRVRTKIR